MSGLLHYLGVGAIAYGALTIALYILSTVIPACGFFALLLASYVSILICATYGVIISILLRLVGYQRIAQWAVARSFKYTMRLTTGITFVIEDPNNYLNTTRPAVFIGNHQTELDVLMLGCIFPKWCSVTAKRSLKSVPFLGWFMTLSGAVFIDRANAQNARHSMAGASEEITKERQSVYMFPEGTRSYSKEPMLLPFKKGAFHLAVQAGVPIVPVVVANYSNVLYVKGWRFRSGEIPVKGEFCGNFLSLLLLTRSSSEANRNETPETIGRRRSGKRYERLDAEGNRSIDGESEGPTHCNASTQCWRWSHQSQWSRGYDIMSHANCRWADLTSREGLRKVWVRELLHWESRRYQNFMHVWSTGILCIKEYIPHR